MLLHYLKFYKMKTQSILLLVMRRCYKMMILLRMSKRLMNRGLPYLDMSIQIYEPSKGLCWLFLRPTAQATEPPGAVADL
jgi:hypothetical protein